MRRRGGGGNVALRCSVRRRTQGDLIRVGPHGACPLEAQGRGARPRRRCSARGSRTELSGRRRYPTRFRQDYWLWPLPPPGDLLIACKWPNVELPLTTATVAAGQLREAADQARELWPAPDLSEWWEQPGPGQSMPPSSGMSIDAVKLVLSCNSRATHKSLQSKAWPWRLSAASTRRRMAFPTADPSNAVREISRHRSDDGNAATVLYRIVGTGTITFSSTTEDSTRAMMAAMRGQVVVTAQTAGS